MAVLVVGNWRLQVVCGGEGLGWERQFAVTASVGAASDIEVSKSMQLVE